MGSLIWGGNHHNISLSICSLLATKTTLSLISHLHSLCLTGGGGGLDPVCLMGKPHTPKIHTAERWRRKYSMVVFWKKHYGKTQKCKLATLAFRALAVFGLPQSQPMILWKTQLTTAPIVTQRGFLVSHIRRSHLMEHLHGMQWNKPPYDFIVTNGRAVNIVNTHRLRCSL